MCNHYSVCGKPYATVRIPNLGPVRLRAPVPGIGGILGARISYRRGRWFIAFQDDLDWNDGEPSDKAAQLAQAKARKAAVAAGMDREAAREAIQVQSERPERLLPLHPNPGTVGGGDLGLIDTMVGRVEALDGARPAVEFRVANPRRLTRTEKQQRLRRRRERKLSRSIHKARLRAAAARKAEGKDTTPVTADDRRGVKLRLSKRQRRQSERLSKELGGPGRPAGRLPAQAGAPGRPLGGDPGARGPARQRHAGEPCPGGIPLGRRAGAAGGFP